MSEHELNQLIGKTLDHYTLVREAGRGGMSTVYEARDNRLGRTVALKVLELPLSLLAGHQDVIGRLEREARAIASLSHPNVVTIFDVGEQEGLHYIVMEFLDGTTLRDRLLQGPLAPHEAGEILSQVADGLDAVHRQGVLHRDIKSANVMLLYNGRVKLLDFGIARADSDTTLTQVGTMVGSPPYLAPELVTGSRASRASDVWALSVLLYEMLTARLPFPSETTLGALYRIANTEPDPLPEVTPEIASVVQKALSKNQEERFVSGHALAEAFHEALAKGRMADTALTAPQSVHAVHEDATVTSLPVIPQDVRETSAAKLTQLKSGNGVSARHQARIYPAPTDVALSQPALPISRRSPLPAMLAVVTLFVIGGFALSQFRSAERQTARTEPINGLPAASRDSGAETGAPQPPPTAQTSAEAALEEPRKTSAETSAKRSLPTVQPRSTTAAMSERTQSRRSTPEIMKRQEPAKTPSNVRVDRQETSVPRRSETPPQVAKRPKPDQRMNSERNNNGSNERETDLPPDEEEETEMVSSRAVDRNQPETEEDRDDKASSLELRDLLNEWISATNAQDIRGQMRFYAPSLSRYYLQHNVSLAAVRSEKRRVLDGASQVAIRAGEPEIHFEDAGRTAIMRFRKDYVIERERGKRRGAVLQELRWRLTEAGWKISSERDLRVLRD